jgi:polyhydroxybutyrate depolymerase
VREYRLEVPDSLDLTKPAPIVFAFHGMGDDNKDHMAATSGLPELAAEHKFILVFPAASAQRIPQGVVNAWALAPEHIPVDLAFFDALLAKLQTQYRLDPQAIFITWMSNGGYFAHLLGRERSDKIAAVAVHSGELGQEKLELITTGRKFPVMIIHGDADPIYPVEYARHARDVYEAAGHSVTYLEIPNWIHQWNSGVDEKIWDFFNSHRLEASPAPAATTPVATSVPAAHS